MHFTVTLYTSILAHPHSADHSNNILHSIYRETSQYVIFCSLCCVLTLTSKYLYQHSVLEHPVCSLPLIYQIHTQTRKHVTGQPLPFTCLIRVGRVYGADGVRHHPHRKHDPRSGSQDHHPSKNSVQKTICCNSTSNAPDDGRMYTKYVELSIY